MKRKSSIIVEAKDVKKYQTNQEKVEGMLQSTEKVFFDSIVDGKISVSRQKQQLQYSKKNGNYFVDSAVLIEQIDLSLQEMRQNLMLKKKQQQYQEQVKREQAQKLIERMKRQKEEHRQRLKDRQNQSRLVLTKAFSETVLHKMRQQLQDRIVNKRKEIEERIKNIEARTKERNEKIGKQYLQRSKSGEYSSQDMAYFSMNPQKPKTERSNDTHLPKIKHVQKIYSSAILDSGKLRLGENKNNHSHLRKIIENNHNLVLPKIGQRDISVSLIIKNSNKLGKLGQNQFIEKLNFKRNELMQKDPDYMQVEEPNYAQQVQTLSQNWKNTLMEIEKKLITMEKGLQQLNMLEKRLDKLDFKGVKERLKLKYKVFQKLEHSSDSKDNLQIENEP